MHTKVRKLFALCIISCFCCLCCVNTTNAETLAGVEILTGTWQGESVEYLAEEILVGLNTGETQASFTVELGAIPAAIVRNDDGTGFVKLQVNTGQDIFNVIDQVSLLPSVRYAEPNLIDRLFAMPNDPDFSKQWHYHNTGQVPPGGTSDADIDAPEGWDITTGSTIIRVGVLDSGIPIQGGSLSHPDLDDASRFLLGYDFVNSDAIPADDRGHGTHVSGTIAAETNNSIGVAGVCWNAQIMAIKVFDASGNGSHELFRDGCIYAADNGCQIINYSGGGSHSATKEAGVAYADDNDVIVCAAAGNDYSGSVIWPAAYSTQYSNCIAVSATDHNDAFSAYSNKGTEVTVAAPGGYGGAADGNDVYSTMPNYTVTMNGLGYTQNSSYMAGTSMACPHVAGLAALILSVDPTMTPYDVRELIKSTADDLGSAGRDDYFGWGRIKVQNALSQIQVDTDDDGILDDGDFSGDPNDNPCTGGAIANCDDNCVSIPNPNQEDFDFDGIGDACDPSIAVYVPSQYPTIQAAINAVPSGATIMVNPGTYTATGFYNIDFNGKDVTVQSVSGASATIIDCGGSGSDNRGFVFENSETSSARLIGFTIRNGDVRTRQVNFINDRNGGAIKIKNASPTIQNCIFESNQAFLGGAIHIMNSGGVPEDVTPSIINCEFRGNSANDGSSGTNNNGGAILFGNSNVTIGSCLFENNTANEAYGGAIYSAVGTSTIYSCTFSGNSAIHGGALYVNGTDLTIVNTIISNSPMGYGIKAWDGSIITYDCNNFWNNSPSSYDISHGVFNIDANTIFENPYFCDAANGDYTIVDNSPCTAEKSPCGQLIGKYGVGCNGPELTMMLPSPNRVDIPVTHEVIAQFDQPMDVTTLDNSMFAYGLTGGPLDGTTGFFSPLTFWIPDNPYGAGDVITYVLTEDMLSTSGFPIDKYVGQFTATVADDSYGTFGSHTLYPAGNKPNSAFLADIDGDGDKDLAVPNHDSHNVSIFMSNGDGTFAGHTIVATGTNPWDVTLVDLDGDGDMDMATSNYGTNNVAVFLNNGSGVFGTPVYYAVGNRPHPILASDLDGDNDFDLITANLYSDDISVLINNGDGTFANQVVYSVADGPIGLASADLDNDGDLDVFVANYYASEVSILYNNSDATFAPFTSLLIGASGPFNIVAADIDGDYDIDLATANRTSDDISIMIQDSPGSFATPQIYTAGDDPYYSEAADFDGDGDLDLVTANLHSDDISVLLNNGDGTFSDQTRYTVGDGPLWVISSDLNNDNRLDLVVANAFSDNVSVYFNEEVFIGPQLVSPVNGYSTYSHSITLDWLDYAGATSYEVIVDGDPNFGSVDRSQTGLISTQWLISPNLGHGTFYWKVRGHDQSGPLVWSDVWHFEIKAVPPDPSCPVLYTYDGSDFVMENPLLTECEKSGYVDIVTDYYQLTKGAVSNDGLVTFQLRELEDEISIIYDVELITVDHDVNSQIACDATGNIFSFDQSFEPISAVDNEGVDQLELVKSSDGVLFNAKNSGWMEISFTKVGSDPNTGISMLAPPKYICPDPVIRKISPNLQEEKPMAQLTLEYEVDLGNWIKHSDIPPRTNLTQEYVLIDNSADTDILKVRLSWEGEYSVDAIQQFIPSKLTPIVNTVSIDKSRILGMPEGINIHSTNNPIELHKGDVYEFSFVTSTKNDDNLIRDYIIKAVGRYEPDYSVFTHLLPNKPQLHGNYPNPFNPTTTLGYSLPSATHVTLEVFNVLGQKIASLVNENQEAGKYEVVWDSKDESGHTVASGIYFYRLTTNEMTANRKMILLK